MYLNRYFKHFIAVSFHSLNDYSQNEIENQASLKREITSLNLKISEIMKGIL